PATPAARRLTPHACRALNSPERPTESPKPKYLLSFLFAQDVGHPGGGPRGPLPRQRLDRYIWWPVVRRLSWPALGDHRGRRFTPLGRRAARRPRLRAHQVSSRVLPPDAERTLGPSGGRPRGRARRRG